MNLDDAIQDIASELRKVEGLRVETELGASLDPPACGFGPAQFQWVLPSDEPSECTLVVGLVVSTTKGPRVYTDMLEWLPKVAAAIESLPNAVVRRANPGTWPSGGVDLPAYLFEVEVALPWR